MSNDDNEKKVDTSAKDSTEYVLYIMQKTFKECVLDEGEAVEPSKEKMDAYNRFITSAFTNKEMRYIAHSITFNTMLTFIKCLNEQPKDESVH